MAKITLPSYIKTSGGRMQDAVIAQWKGVTYMKPYSKPVLICTDKQRSVRAAFTSLVADWKNLSGAVRRSWEKSVKGENKTGFNAFIGNNLTRRRKGELIMLSASYGEEPAANLAAGSGSTSGSIVLSFDPLPAGKHLTLFIRREVPLDIMTRLFRHDCGADPVSPVTIDALEPGAVYSVYAAVTDAAYEEAQTVSESAAVMATAK